MWFEVKEALAAKVITLFQLLHKPDVEVAHVVDFDAHADLVDQLLDVICVEPFILRFEIFKRALFATKEKIKAFVDIDGFLESKPVRTQLDDVEDHGSSHSFPNVLLALKIVYFWRLVVHVLEEVSALAEYQQPTIVTAADRVTILLFDVLVVDTLQQWPILSVDVDDAVSDVHANDNGDVVDFVGPLHALDL